MTIVEYEVGFHTLSRYLAVRIYTKSERIWKFVKRMDIIY